MIQISALVMKKQIAQLLKVMRQTFLIDLQDFINFNYNYKTVAGLTPPGTGTSLSKCRRWWTMTPASP